MRLNKESMTKIKQRVSLAIILSKAKTSELSANGLI